MSAGITRTKTAEVIAELAEEYNIAAVYRKYSHHFYAAVQLAFGAASQALRRFARVLMWLGNKSMSALETLSPTAASLARGVGSMFGAATGGVASVSAQVLSFVKESWITRTIAVLFVFRYVYNHCIGMDDSDMDELQTETESIFSSIINSVTPGPVASVISFCINSMTSAMRFALLPIRVALGPVVAACAASSSRMLRAEALQLEEQRKQTERADNDAALKLQQNSAAAAELVRSEQRAQVDHLVQMQKMQQEYKHTQSTLRMRQERERMDQQAKLIKSKVEQEEVFNQRTAAEQKVGAYDYFTVPVLGMPVPLPGFVGNLMGAPRRTLAEEKMADELAERRKRASTRPNEKTNIAEPKPTGKRTEPAPMAKTMSAASSLLSPGCEISYSGWRQTRRLGHLRPLSVS